MLESSGTGSGEFVAILLQSTVFSPNVEHCADQCMWRSTSPWPEEAGHDHIPMIFQLQGEVWILCFSKYSISGFYTPARLFWITCIYAYNYILILLCLCASQCLSTRSLASRRFASEETSGETPIKFVSIRWNVSVTCIVDNSKDSRDLVVTNAISTVQVSHVPSYNNLEALQGKLEKCYNVQVWFLP